MTKWTDKRPAPPASGTRVAAFARIARKTAAETTDPKVMAIARSRQAPSRGFDEARSASQTTR